MMSNMEVDWEAEECVTWEELEARREGYCTADGGEWTSLREGWGPECYIAGENEWADCIISGPDMEYYWETDECLTT